jgi:2-dehydro-3-deoxyphosphogluconate aldolase/(4S)-4-hydroxy-2-oxoglutarate aldolase
VAKEGSKGPAAHVSPAVAEMARIGIMPVIVIDDASAAGDLADALAAGGVPCAEITLRTPAGLTALAAAASREGFLAGGGTVLTTDDVDRCADSGARFVVSPGLDEDVVERALQRGLVAIPGVATATEVQRAWKAGLDRVKFFPARNLGGVAAIEALAGPFADMRFMPSGGVGIDDVSDYSRSQSVFAVSGGWLAPRSAIRAHAWDEIARRAAASVVRLAR